jgi:hypothetical protein
VVTETGEVINTEQDLDEVIVQGQSNNYEVVINDTYKTTTTKQPESISVFANQKLKMKLQKNNGDTINADNIWWKVGKERTDSTLTKEINVVDKSISVIIYESIKDKEDDKIIANIEFTIRKSPYVTFSPFPKYDGEFGFDDGEDFQENSVPKQTMQYDTIHVADEKNKIKILYVPWLTLLQGQPYSLQVEISGKIEEDNIYVECTTDKLSADYDGSKKIIVTNNSLENDFVDSEYINFYRDDKYGFQKQKIIGKLAIVGMNRERRINVQIVYFTKDTAKLKKKIVLDKGTLKTQLNTKSFNQAGISFNVLDNVVKLRNSLKDNITTNKHATVTTIIEEYRKRGVKIT